METAPVIQPTPMSRLDWHDPTTAERFIAALSDALGRGQSHPQAIASARRAVEPAAGGVSPVAHRRVPKTPTAAVPRPPSSA